MSVEFERLLIASPHVVCQMMSGGAVLMDKTTGQCFELNRLGTDVWREIERGAPLSDIVIAIATQYEMPQEQVSGDVQQLATHLVKYGLARLRDD